MCKRKDSSIHSFFSLFIMTAYQGQDGRMCKDKLRMELQRLVSNNRITLKDISEFSMHGRCENGDWMLVPPTFNQMFNRRSVGDSILIFLGR